MGNNDNSGGAPLAAAKDSREAKLAQALRDNLKRRKASARESLAAKAKSDSAT
ncbi:MAG: hypothetical protein JWP35_3415 [Caulobacter sp.]|nr:hypothetical protein [Caulobacter sp.]